VELSYTVQLKQNYNRLSILSYGVVSKRCHRN